MDRWDRSLALALGPAQPDGDFHSLHHVNFEKLAGIINPHHRE